MATKNPRIHTVLEAPLYRAVALLARKDHVSLSQKVRDLVEDALELMEDAVLERVAEERRKTFDRRTALTGAELRRRLHVR